MDGGDLITVELSNDFFNCPICLEPYRTPIFQCNAGHSLCSYCRGRLGKVCTTCKKATVYKHNKTLESIVTEAKFRCVNNSKYGCRELSSCYDKPNHERKCIYLPITRLKKGMENSKYFLLVPAEFCSEPYHLITADVCIKIQAANAMQQPQRVLLDR